MVFRSMYFAWNQNDSRRPVRQGAAAIRMMRSVTTLTEHSAGKRKNKKCIQQLEVVSLSKSTSYKLYFDPFLRYEVLVQLAHKRNKSPKQVSSSTHRFILQMPKLKAPKPFRGCLSLAREWTALCSPSAKIQGLAYPYKYSTISSCTHRNAH